MAELTSFRVVNITAATKEEAFGEAPFEIAGDVTRACQAWKDKLGHEPTQGEFGQFMMDCLQKRTKSLPGLGLVITDTAPVVNKRERPYKITDVKDKPGTKKFKKVYQLVDADTGNVVAETEGKKSDAMQMARDLYIKNGYKGNLVCQRMKKVVAGEAVAFTVEYAPSQGTRDGSWTAFGIERY